MKIAIMQPYFFPYIGYFQLINAVEKFIFYDDVNYIKGGWINRNNILIQDDKKYINLTLNKASSFKKINEIQIKGNQEKILKTIKQNYSKAPYFKEVYRIIYDTLSTDSILLSEVSALSVKKIASYLKLNTIFEFSSKQYSKTLIYNRADRLIEICKINNANEYVNPIGGKELYKKKYFKDKGIDLLFIDGEITPYKQFNNDRFISNLSIIDILMFNDIKTINKMLKNYKLI